MKRGGALHNPTKSPQQKPTSKSGRNSDNPKIQQLIQARKENEKQKKAHRKFLTDMIVRAYSIGLGLMEDDDGWLSFCALDWGKLTAPKKSQSDQAIRFALKFIFAKGKKGEKRASFYYNAIKEFAQKGLEPTRLAKAINDAGGLKKLQRQNTRKPDAKPDRVLQDDTVSEKIGKSSKIKPGSQQLKPSKKERAYPLDPKELPARKVGDKKALEMPVRLMFSKTPGDLLSAKLPVRIVVKGTLMSLGEVAVIKVEEYKIKKPKS